MTATAASVPERSLEGHYAGVASRALAFAADVGTVLAVYSIGTAGLRFIVRLVFDQELLDEGSWGWSLSFVLWVFLYGFYCWGISGKTLGCALVGIRVVRQDGTHLGFRRAFVRTVVFPFSFLFAGLGLVGIALGRRHRAWHDMAARSTVVYDWDARAARLRFLARRGST